MSFQIGSKSVPNQQFETGYLGIMAKTTITGETYIWMVNAG